MMGSWRFECKFCNKTYVRSRTRVVTHLLQEGINEIKGRLKVTPQERDNMKKFINELQIVDKTCNSYTSPITFIVKKASTSSLGYNMRYKFPDTSESDSKKIKEMGAASEKLFNNQAMKQCDGELARKLCISGLSFNVARNHHYHKFICSYITNSRICFPWV